MLCKGPPENQNKATKKQKIRKRKSELKKWRKEIKIFSHKPMILRLWAKFKPKRAKKSNNIAENGIFVAQKGPFLLLGFCAKSEKISKTKLLKNKILGKFFFEKFQR